MVALNDSAARPRVLAVVQAGARPRRRWRDRAADVGTALAWITLAGLCVMVWACVWVGAVVLLQWLWQWL